MLKFVTERYVNNLMLKEQLCFKGCISFTIFFSSKERQDFSSSSYYMVYMQLLKFLLKKKYVKYIHSKIFFPISGLGHSLYLVSA